MANATLWYKVNVSDTLGGVPAGQKISFNDTTIVLRDYQWDWDNNVKQTSNPNDTGQRIINVIDNGFLGLRAILTGVIKASEIVPSDNLFLFLQVLQTPDALQFGRFCIDNPNGPKMSFVSDATKGLAIGPGTKIKYNQTNKSYDFTYVLYFGGKFV